MALSVVHGRCKYMYTRITYVYVYMHISVYVCVYIGMPIYVCIYIYIYMCKPMV